MSIKTEIDRIITAVTKAHQAVEDMGGNTAAPYLVEKLEAAVRSIPKGEDLSAELEAQDVLISQLEEAVASKASGGGGGTAEPPNIQSLTVTENGTYTASENVDGYSPVVVAVPEKTPVLQPLTVTENGTYPVPESADGYGTVTVNVPSSGGGEGSASEAIKAMAEGTITEVTAEDLAGVTVLRWYAFYNCQKLTKITLPEGLINISYGALQNTWELKELTIPETVTTIGAFALQTGTASNKTTFTFLPKTPPSIHNSVFIATKLAKIIVPKGCGEAYRTADIWKDYWADYIEESAT